MQISGPFYRMSLRPNLSVRFGEFPYTIKHLLYTYVRDYVNHSLTRVFFDLRGQIEAPASAHTMVSGRNSPYHRPYLGDAQSKRINVTSTLWAIIPAVGLGVAHCLLPPYSIVRHSVKM